MTTCMHKALYKIPKSLINKFLYRNMASVAICQITSTHNKEENYEVCSKLIKKAAESNAKMVFLPEACDYMGRSTREILSMAEPLNGPTLEKYKELAKDLKVWISLGGVHEKLISEKVSNSHVIIDDLGNIAGVYQKVHLFDVEIPEKKLSLMESKYVEKGMKIGPPVSSPIGMIGLGIVRIVQRGMEHFYNTSSSTVTIQDGEHAGQTIFRLIKMGAEILTYPSAFTTTTGPDHWEVLLRARAIESQCYVIAAAQVGTHFKGRSSYGHGMILDPWGKILAEFADQNEGVILADVNLEKLAAIRQNMPVANHQRDDIYYSKQLMLKSINEQSYYQFGTVNLKNSVVFFKTHLTIAFVNKRCVLPGHVLVAPIRGAKRLADLTKEESEDFFEVVRIVQRGMEHFHNTSSSTVTIQDGEHAGQTIFHVHAHIIPRKKNDLGENDKIYSRLENHENDENIKIRTEEQMEHEAAQLYQHLKSLFSL